MSIVELAPSEYEGEILCERCGDDGNGRRFAICAGGRYTHQESCERYIYRDLCAEREADMEEGYQLARSQEPQDAGITASEGQR